MSGLMFLKYSTFRILNSFLTFLVPGYTMAGSNKPSCFQNFPVNFFPAILFASSTSRFALSEKGCGRRLF
jgi:hypothetical protein